QQRAADRIAVEIVWWCYPYFDSDPICCSLLQPQQPEQEKPYGMIGVQFENASLVEQSYVRNSAILITRFADDNGNGIEICDFAPRFYMHGRLFSPSMLVRIIKRVSGRPRVALHIRPSINYGAQPAEIRTGAHHISYIGSTQAMRITTDAAVSAVTDGKPFYLEECVTLLMGPDETVNGPPREIGRSFREQTLN